MRYEHIVQGIFLERPNRFIAHVVIDGKQVVCHVKNTGRCRELLLPGVVVYMEDHGDTTTRKTRYSLIAVVKDGKIINMDSQAPNKIAREWIEKGGLGTDICFLKQEYTYGKSRFDMYYERKNGCKGFVEVKGVTLEENGIARFPDAPTERGVKHIRELQNALQNGYEATLLFVIQMQEICHMEPNYMTHMEFGVALEEAWKSGVDVLAVNCTVTENEILAEKKIPVRLGNEWIKESEME